MIQNKPQTLAHFNQIYDNINNIDFAKYSFQTAPVYNRHFRQKDLEKFIRPFNLPSSKHS